MSPLRIVLVMIEPPLPFGNAAARWFYVLFSGLVERGHNVTAFATCSKPEEMARASELFPSPRYDLRCYPFPKRRGLWSKLQTFWRPYSYMFGTDLKSDLETELARGFDVLHLEQLWSAWLGLKHVDRALVNVHHLTWIDLSEYRHPHWRGRVAQRVMLATERNLVRRLKYFRACSPRLEPEMRAANPQADIAVVPVGIDPEQYRYLPDGERTGEAVVSVIGTMNWHPTRSAAERLLTRLWPKIKKRVPAARVQIVGWGARAALADYLDLPDVGVEENVPEIEPYFRRTGVLLYAPGRGSGMKIKVLEALAYGVPVVTTAEGVEGIPAVDGVHAGIAEDDADLIERTVRLLQDTAAQNRQRAAGRALLESHCGPRPTLDALEAVYARRTRGNGANHD